MVRNDNGINVPRLMMDRQCQVIRSGFTRAVRSVDEGRIVRTHRPDPGGSDEEFRRRRGGNGGGGFSLAGSRLGICLSGLDEQRVGRLVQVDRAEGVYGKVGLEHVDVVDVSGDEWGVDT